MNLLTACKKAFRKHSLDDDSIGWEELTSDLCDALCNEMRDNIFQEWLDSQPSRDQKDHGQAEQEKLKALWSHVKSFRDEPECMKAIYDCLLSLAIAEIEDYGKILYPLLDRIAKTKGSGSTDSWHFHGSAMVLKVEGDWHITNSDLCFWRDICFLGDRDFFSNQFSGRVRQITKALHDKRTYQTLTRYLKNGGISAEHRILLSKLKWQMDMWRGDGYSLLVGGKRPFGNSFVEGDIFDILGWETDWEEWDEAGYDSAEERERAWEIFDELRFAIIDTLSERIKE